MRNLLTWMYKAIGRARRMWFKSLIFSIYTDCTLGERQAGEPGQEYHNHASPEVLDRKPPTHPKPAPIIVPNRSSLAALPYPPTPSSPAPKSPVSPTSLLTPQRTTRARSMSDLLSQAARDHVAETSAAVLRKASAVLSSTNLPPRPTLETVGSQTDGPKEPERDSQGENSGMLRTSENNTSVVVVQSKLEPDPLVLLYICGIVIFLTRPIQVCLCNVGPVDCPSPWWERS